MRSRRDLHRGVCEFMSAADDVAGDVGNEVDGAGGSVVQLDLSVGADRDAGSRSECSIQISSARNSYASNTLGGNDLRDAVLEEWSGWRRTSPMLSVRRRWSHRPQPWGVDVDPLVTRRGKLQPGCAAILLATRRSHHVGKRH